MPAAGSPPSTSITSWRDDCGGTYDDTEGLINLPLTVKEILAVVFFKENGPDDWRISMRSKGDVDVNAVAKEFGGGGHKNASGCSRPRLARGAARAVRPQADRGHRARPAPGDATRRPG